MIPRASRLFGLKSMRDSNQTTHWLRAILSLALLLSVVRLEAQINLWACQQVRELRVPTDESVWSNNGIDRFVLTRLTQAGRRELIRFAPAGMTSLPGNVQRTRSQ